RILGSLRLLSGHRKRMAIVAGTLLAALAAFVLLAGLDHVSSRHGQREIALQAQRTISLAEARTTHVLQVLDELTSAGAASCLPSSLERMRLAALATTPIKELSLVSADGH